MSHALSEFLGGPSLSQRMLRVVALPTVGAATGVYALVWKLYDVWVEKAADVVVSILVGWSLPGVLPSVLPGVLLGVVGVLGTRRDPQPGPFPGQMREAW